MDLCVCVREGGRKAERRQVNPTNSRRCHRPLTALGHIRQVSYAALISHESDFRTAEERHLLPQGVEWPVWRTFVEELDTQHIYPDMGTRFYYGELRLSRLNKIYSLWQTPLRAYKSHWNQYGTSQENFRLASWCDGLYHCCPDCDAGRPRHRIPRRQCRFSGCIVFLAGLVHSVNPRCHGHYHIDILLSVCQ